MHTTSKNYNYLPYQPRLIRASTLNLPAHQLLMNVQVTLDFYGDINSMTTNWNEIEIKNSRRLVLINSIQDYSHLNLQFKPINQQDYIPGSAVLSCIYWKKTGRFYLTSVELISLLEHLVNSKFPVEEKNRIRRNLQSIKPLTISKSNDEYSELFDLIMNFSNPKPRRIEKDVKVIYWDHLKEALAKVLSKYIVDPTQELQPPMPQQLQPIQQQLPQQIPIQESQPRYFNDEQFYPVPQAPQNNIYFVSEQQYITTPVLNYPIVNTNDQFESLNQLSYPLNDTTYQFKKEDDINYNTQFDQFGNPIFKEYE